MDDVDLVARVRRGDEAAFVTIFDRYRAAVFRYALHMRRHDAASADDIVQDVFLAFLRQIGTFDERRGGIVPYLLGIARRQILRDIDRRRLDEPIDDAAPLIAPDIDPLEGLARAETVAQVRAAIAALPQAFREVIVLCELNDLDYVTAAAVVGCPIGTVRSRLHRARALLLRILERSCRKTSIA